MEKIYTKKWIAGRYKKTLVCNSCKNEVDINDNFCKNCGVSFN